jgi:hypothetical protein
VKQHLMGLVERDLLSMPLMKLHKEDIWSITQGLKADLYSLAMIDIVDMFEDEPVDRSSASLATLYRSVFVQFDAATAQRVVHLWRLIRRVTVGQMAEIAGRLLTEADSEIAAGTPPSALAQEVFAFAFPQMNIIH